MATVTESERILVVQRNELAAFPQPSFRGLGVAVTGDSVPLLAPMGKIDHVTLGWRGDFGGEDDLQ